MHGDGRKCAKDEHVQARLGYLIAEYGLHGLKCERRQCLIDRQDRLLDRFADDRRIALRPHDKDGRKPGQLWPVYKNLGLHRFSRGILTNVGNNADNLSHGALAVVCNDNLLSDWILTWKVLPCQRVVNHRDRWSIR